MAEMACVCGEFSLKRGKNPQKFTLSADNGSRIAAQDCLHSGKGSRNIWG